MEHILQFAVNIDDETIKSRIEKSATDKMANELTRDVRDAIFSRWHDSGFSLEAERIIKGVLEDSKDEIIERASKMVAESIKRSKRYKEALAEIGDA